MITNREGVTRKDCVRVPVPDMTISSHVYSPPHTLYQKIVEWCEENNIAASMYYVDYNDAANDNVTSNYPMSQYWMIRDEKARTLFTLRWS